MPVPAPGAITALFPIETGSRYGYSASRAYSPSRTSRLRSNRVALTCCLMPITSTFTVRGCPSAFRGVTGESPVALDQVLAKVQTIQRRFKGVVAGRRPHPWANLAARAPRSHRRDAASLGTEMSQCASSCPLKAERGASSASTATPLRDLKFGSHAQSRSQRASLHAVQTSQRV